MGSWTEPLPWLPAALNDGWTYRDRPGRAAEGQLVSAYYAARYRHSGRRRWLERLAAGEISRNGQRLDADGRLAAGDRLAWRRPPWREEAVPVLPPPLFDDGDLLVLAKPSGLPVLPAGGWLEHTVLRQLERRHRNDAAGLPRPVHRLGRFTSGLLVCARRPASRAWLSARLRESTAATTTATSPPAPLPAGPPPPPCRKTYRALLQPGSLDLRPGECLEIQVPIGQRPHPLLGRIWCADPGGGLPASSCLTLLERRPGADLVAVRIASGRPHQIRIHCAAVGAPLLGDPLYGPGGRAADQSRPGAGGYRLHAHRLQLLGPDGALLELEAPLPPELAQQLP
ncbi:MAG: pseudouridine synthase [Synechococcaceae cyanobacterium]|nr:pseudouridine synthase [Synechococcaceae cyanobacterium]